MQQQKKKKKKTIRRDAKFVKQFPMDDYCWFCRDRQVEREHKKQIHKGEMREMRKWKTIGEREMLYQKI